VKKSIPPLPYEKEALEPHIGGLTVEVHYEKHHKGYLAKLEQQIEGKPEESQSLEQLIQTAHGGVFNNAAQVWNHTFYWNSLKPGAGGKASGELLKQIESCFRSFDAFKKALAETADGEFGSGWAWLILDRAGRLRVVSTHDADNPLRHGAAPLLAIDVWEHAYYLDRMNRRDQYVRAVIDHLLDWDFASENLKRARQRGARA
jgi:Fe-Mn family superoxide dismutase